MIQKWNVITTDSSFFWLCAEFPHKLIIHKFSSSLSYGSGVLDIRGDEYEGKPLVVHYFYESGVLDIISDEYEGWVICALSCSLFSYGSGVLDIRDDEYEGGVICALSCSLFSYGSGVLDIRDDEIIEYRYDFNDEM